MIVDAPNTDTPIGSVIWIDKSTMTMFTMAVKVRELNVTQTLQVHFRLATKDDMNPRFTAQDLIPQGGMPLRDLMFQVQTDPLHEHECAQLQVAVSGSFIHSDNPSYFDISRSDDNADVAEANWWIWEGKGQAQTTDLDKAHLLSSCATMETKLTQTMPMMMDMGTTP
jgi:hypothetical protein